MTVQQMRPADLEQLRRLSTCIVASAIEGFQMRLPNSGFTDSRISCIFKNRLPLIGYAATARIRSKNHGVQTVPLEIADKVPAVAHQIMHRREHLIGLCRATDFSIERLREAIREPDPKS